MFLNRDLNQKPNAIIFLTWLNNAIVKVFYERAVRKDLPQGIKIESHNTWHDIE